MLTLALKLPGKIVSSAATVLSLDTLHGVHSAKVCSIRHLTHDVLTVCVNLCFEYALRTAHRCTYWTPVKLYWLQSSLSCHLLFISSQCYTYHWPTLHFILSAIEIPITLHHSAIKWHLTFHIFNVGAVKSWHTMSTLDNQYPSNETGVVTELDVIFNQHLCFHRPSRSKAMVTFRALVHLCSRCCSAKRFGLLTDYAISMICEPVWVTRLRTQFMVPVFATVKLALPLQWLKFQWLWSLQH